MVRAFAHGAMCHRIDPSLSYFSFQPDDMTYTYNFYPNFYMQYFERKHSLKRGARSSSVVRASAHGVIGHRIDPSW